MKYITGDKWLRVTGYWLMLLGIILIAGCSSDSTGADGDGMDVPRQGYPLQVVPYTANYQAADFQMRAVSEDYSLYTPDHEIAIGLYVLENGEVSGTPAVKLISYSNNDWHSQATVEENKNYTIYGFMPKKDPISSSISKSDDVVTLTLSNISTVSADDVCFITGVKDLDDDLLQGQFDYTGKADNNYLRLLLDHLFASVKFNFQVNATYKTLRTIKVKSLTLNTTAGTMTATVKLTPNTTDTYPATVEYTTPTTGTSSATFFESTEGVEIPSTTTSFVCCFAPAVASSLTLVTTYDVYDRKGNLIRKDCEATNKLPDNLNLASQPTRGQQVTLTLTVNPTYLYQLSDPDLDNPTFTIEGE